MDNTYSLADIGAVTNRDNDLWGGSSWIIILVILLFGGGNFWGRNNFGERAATVGDVQRGFDTQEIIAKLNGLENGLCDGFYAQNTTMLTGFNTIGNLIAENRFAQQTCCCETNRNIDALRYESAQHTCSIQQAITEGIQRVIDNQNCIEMSHLKDENMRNYISSQLCGVVRYPNATTYTAGYSPCFSNYSQCNTCC